MINLRDKRWLGVPIVFLVLLVGLTTGGIALASTVFYQAHVNFTVLNNVYVNYDNTTNWDTQTDTWSPPAMYPGQSISTTLVVYNDGDTPVPVTIDFAAMNGDAGAGAWFTVEWTDSDGGSGGGGFTVPASSTVTQLPGWVEATITLETSVSCEEGDYGYDISLMR